MIDEALKTFLYPDIDSVISAITLDGSPMNLKVYFENSQDDIDSSVPYCEIRMVTENVETITFGNPGNNRHRKTGRLVVKISVPIGESTYKIDRIVSVLETEYTPSRVLSEIRFKTAIPRTPGNRVGDNWQVLVDLPFSVDRRA